MRDPDTYAALEFQGYVTDIPLYDRDSRTLVFKAKTLRSPPLSFKAKGELAKAYKTLLHCGCFIQVTASPTKRLVRLTEEKKGIIIEWEAKRIEVLGKKKIKLSSFADVRILDGLMPAEDEITDVGYVEPITFGRFMERRERIKAKELKGDEPK